ncbi:MAG: tautomerase family protein [Acidobacteriota bacterium]
MPVIIVKARQGVIKDQAAKAKLISGMAKAFADAAGDPAFAGRATVILEEVPDDNWGRGGEQVSK